MASEFVKHSKQWNIIKEKIGNLESNIDNILDVTITVYY